MPDYKERIICPECKAEQEATVEDWGIAFAFYHECKCGHIITESEWEPVDAAA